MQRKYIGAIMGIITFLMMGVLVSAMPRYQSPLTTDQQLQLTDTSLISTNYLQDTRIAVLMVTKQILPSPSPFTSTWTRTPTPVNTAIPFTPTIEDARTPSQTAFPSFTPTHTATPQNTQIATRPPFLDPNFTCRVVTTSNLTKRLTPSPSAENLGVLLAGSNVLIAPYQGSIPYSTSSGYWYIPVMENGEIAYYILYARTSPPSEATPNTTPSILETYLIPAIPAVPCIPVILRS